MCCTNSIIFFFFSPFTRLSIFALCSFSPLLSPLFLSHTPYLNRFLPTLRSAKSRSGFSRAFNYGIRSGPGAVYLGTFLFLFLCVESTFFLQMRKAGSVAGFCFLRSLCRSNPSRGDLPEYLCHRNRKRTVHAAYRRTVRSPSALHCCSPSPPFPNKNRTPMCAEGLPHFPLYERAFLD